MKVPINFEDKILPVSAKLFKPLVYRDGDNICVVLGPDPQQGVFGCGPTTADALKDWDMHLKERLADSKKDDEVRQYILATLNGPLDEIE